VEGDIVGLEIGNDSAIVARHSGDDPASYRISISYYQDGSPYLLRCMCYAASMTMQKCDHMPAHVEGRDVGLVSVHMWGSHLRVVPRIQAWVHNELLLAAWLILTWILPSAR